MEYFDYTAKVVDTNKTEKGIIEAEDIKTAAEMLKVKGLIVINISPMQDFLNLREIIYSMSYRISKKNIKDFFDQLSFMLKTNLPMNNALLILRDSGVDKKIKYISRLVVQNTQKGDPLNIALQKTDLFDTSAIMQIKAGEESGNVPKALIELTKQYERDIEFMGKIKNAMTYPVLILIVMSIVLYVLLTMVVPSISNTLISLGGELPTITKIVIFISNTLTKATPFIIVGIIVAVVLFRQMMKNEQFSLKLDELKLNIPIAGDVITKIEISRLCRNLSVILNAGIALVPSLSITQTAIKNRSIKNAVKKAGKLVEIKGAQLSTALSLTGAFPDMIIQHIEVGVNAGKVTDILDKISTQYEKEVDNSIKKITGLMEPIMIVVVGLIAGTVVIAMFLPMLSLLDSLM